MQRLAYATGALIAVFVIVGLILPQTSRVEVATEIDAGPATVFALINDFRRMRHWSPRFDSDPNVRVLFSGPVRGVDAMMTWDGAVVGVGRQVIKASEPYTRIETEVSADGERTTQNWYELARKDQLTTITHGFEADYGFNIIARYFSPILRRVAAQENSKGLARLKELAESLPKADFSTLDVEHIVVEPTDIAFLPVKSKPESVEISESMARAYFQILRFIDRHSLADDGAPMSIARGFDGSDIAFDAAIPVRGLGEEVLRDDSGVEVGKTYGGAVVRIRHIGSYERLDDTHRKILAYLAALGIRRNGAAWESYVSDPGNVSEEELQTFVFYPVKTD